MHKLAISLVIALSALAGFALFSPAQTVLAASTPQQTACEAINGTAGCTDANSNLTPIIKVIVNVMSLVVGVIAIIMIIMAGFKYITSGGESNKVAAAKNALIYAIVGLIIVALAQFMVRVVLKEAQNVNSAVPSTSTTTPKPTP